MEVVYTRRLGSIRSMPVQSEAERQLHSERLQRSRLEAELLEARRMVASAQTRLSIVEAELAECRSYLVAERARMVVAPAPPIEATPPREATLSKRAVGRPRKVVIEKTPPQPQPVKWWARGSKWDTKEN